MHTEYVKWREVCERLNIDQDGYNHYEQLCCLIVSKISNAVGFGSYLNCISGTLISQIILSLTGITLTTSNLCNYKQTGQHFVKDISDALGVPIAHGIPFNLTKNTEQSFAFTALPDSPSAALATILNNGDYAVKDTLYEFWQSSNSFNVGSSKNWPSLKLLKILQKRKLQIIVPASHDTPVKMRRLLKHITDLLELHDISDLNQSTLNEAVQIFCTAEQQNKINRNTHWLPSFSTLPLLQYVDELTSDFRQSPYFYVKEVNSLSKIGSADRCNDRVKTDSFAVVLTLKSRSENGDARKIESIVRRQLARCHILPVDGKLDHYNVPITKLAPVIIGAIGQNAEIASMVHQITATKLLN